MQSNASPSPAAPCAVFCVKWEPSNFLSSSTFSDDTVPPLPASRSQLMWTWRIFVAAASRTNFLPFAGSLLEVFLTPAKSIALRCPFKSWRCRATCFFLFDLYDSAEDDGEGRGRKRESGGRRTRKIGGGEMFYRAGWMCVWIHRHAKRKEKKKKNKWGRPCVLFRRHSNEHCNVFRRRLNDLSYA